MSLINQMRKSKISQADLSRVSGISQGLISEYISGKKIPGAKNLLRISEALHCSIDDLLKPDIIPKL